jgi:hypothetical protein
MTRQYAAVKLVDEIRERLEIDDASHPLLEEEAFILFGEIPNVKGKCVVLGITTGTFYSGHPIENYVEIQEDEWNTWIPDNLDNKLEEGPILYTLTKTETEQIDKIHDKFITISSSASIWLSMQLGIVSAAILLIILGMDLRSDVMVFIIVLNINLMVWYIYSYLKAGFAINRIRKGKET